MRAMALLAALGLVAGCATPALHGIPEERRVALPEELLGKWQDIDEDEQIILTVEPQSDRSAEVLLAFLEQDREPVELRLAVSAIEVAGERLLDVTLSESELDKVLDRYGMLLIPTHLFCRVRSDAGSITLAFLDDDWLKGRLPTEHLEQFNEMPLLTGDSSELIELLSAAAGDDSAWEDDCTLTRGS
jgi:hypothetical protein